MTPRLLTRPYAETMLILRQALLYRRPPYGTMYGMHKTTVYLPDDLKPALARVAAARGQSEAELIREVLRRAVAEAATPRPRVPLFESGKRGLAERVDEELAGFGET